MNEKNAISNWDESDRPREKLEQLGPQSLSNSELLAVIIRSGHQKQNALELSQSLLIKYGNDLNRLSAQSLMELMKFKGIGRAKALGIIASLEIGHRRNRVSNIKKMRISSSNDAYDCLAPDLSNLNHEEFWIILLNRANRVIRLHQISKGGMHGTVVDPKLVFKIALDYRACGIILGHNHPSGNTDPSRQDKELTYKIKEGAQLIDMMVFDHIIVGDQSYYSFADNNLI